MSEKVITPSRATSSTAGFRMISDAQSEQRIVQRVHLAPDIEYDTSHTM